MTRTTTARWAVRGVVVVGVAAGFMLRTPDAEDLPAHWVEPGPEDVTTTPPAPDAPGPWVVFASGSVPDDVEGEAVPTRMREIVCVPEAMMTLPPPVPDEVVAMWVVPLPVDAPVPAEGDPCPADP